MHSEVATELALLAEVKALVERQSYHHALRVCDELIRRIVSYHSNDFNTILESALQCKISITRGLHDDFDQACDLVLTLYDQLIAHYYETLQTKKVAEAYYQKAAFLELGIDNSDLPSSIVDKEFETLSAFIDRFQSSLDPEIQVHVRDLLERRWVLVPTPEDERYEQAYKAYSNYLLARPLNTKSIAALMEMANIAGDLKKFDTEVSIYNAIIDCIDHSAVSRQTHLEVLLARAITLPLLDRRDQSMLDYQEVLKIAEEETDRSFIADALEGLAYHFVGLGRIEHAVALYDEIISRFGVEPGLKRVVSAAIECRGKVLRNET